jgi:threonine dehydrogenase-like Zn-dependent dehydrogenase
MTYLAMPEAAEDGDGHHLARAGHRRALQRPLSTPPRTPARSKGATFMRGALMYAPGDVRVEDRPDPAIIDPTDAIIRISATCICGSDLWPYRGIEAITSPAPMGHEYAGIVEQIGDEVRSIRVGDFVVGSFFASDNTCEICRAGYQSRCVHAELIGAIGTQAQAARIPLADGTLVATPGTPDPDLIPSLLAASDVLGTGWFAAVAAEAGPGKTVAVVGDGAVGLLGVLAARQLGAHRIIAMSRHADRQALARDFGATDIVTERGDQGAGKIKELTDGLGAHSVIEAVGTQESMMQAIRSTRPGGHVGYVGVSHNVQLPGEELFFSAIHLHGGPAPVRRFMPELIQLIWDRKIDPGKVFDLTLPLQDAAEGYKAMDQRRAIKALLTV